MTPEPIDSIERHEELDLRGVYSENKLDDNKTKKKSKRFRWLKLAFLLLLAGGLAFTFFTSKTISGSNPAGSGFSWLSNVSLVGQISHLATGQEQKLKGEERGRVNILLTGVGGKNHDGGMLADTIMLLSLDPATKQVALTSIPRDLTVPIDGYGWRKINSVNAFAEKENPGSGGLAFSQAFSQIFNQPIDYYVRVDFAGFSQFVDDLGGIEVNVERQLDDYAYPIMGQEDNPNYYSRYEHLRVLPGQQHMDGSLALKFARSRHGINGEGSDFARSSRQQLIISAVKEKLKETNLLFKPTLITKSFENYKENVSTNMQVWEIMRLWSLFKDTQKDQIINKVVDASANGLLRSTRGADGAYILVPKAGDFSEIQYLLANLFQAPPTEVKSLIETEKPTLIVKNGTWVNGLGSKVATDLETYGFTVNDISNADKKNYPHTVIYDLSGGAKPQSLEQLKAKTDANVIADIPAWLNKELESDASYVANFVRPDFVVIVGQSAYTKKAGTTTNETK